MLNDIKNVQLPLENKLSKICGKNNEDSLKNIEELVMVLVREKYNSITVYYDHLFSQIINEYKLNKSIDKEKVKLCIEIMNNYYDGVIGIKNFFNI